MNHDPQYERSKGITHVHLCPSCFRYVPCDWDCTLYGDEVTDSSGLPVQHPILCDECGDPSAFIEKGFDPIYLGM